MPLIVDCHYPELTSDLVEKRLPGKVFYNVKDVTTVQDANRLMENVRAYIT